MISAPEILQTILRQNTTLESRPACTMEYNMNSLIDGVTVVSTATTDNYIAGITEWSTKKTNPFKLLFPVDSIIKSFRPEYPGAKYFIMGGSNVTDTTDKSFLPFRTLKYTGEGKDFNIQGAKPRVYYPGPTTEYKYWLSPLNANINLTVQYLQTSATWLAAGKTGSIPTGNKAALANKVLIKFEKFHSIPTNYKVTITKSDDTTAVVGPLTTTESESGLISLTLEGGTWTKRDGISTLPYTVTLDNPILIKSIKLEATNPGGGKYLGVIEISARWVTNITNDLVQVQINKESSASSEDILPVGLVTSNTMTAGLNRYNQSALKIKTYNRDSTSFETDVIYMAKNVEIRPYFDFIHPSGGVTLGGLTFDRLAQGVYYMDSWEISQHGETSLVALDGSKYLMETLCPDLLCQNSPVVAIIRNLLDSIGFTNYKFNITDTDRSIPNVNYWWTEDTNTVWDELQSLCRDIQMNAFFDENNILQFYSRDYLYSQTTSLHNFYQSQSGGNLPNIISFTKKEIASANSVRVIWKSPTSSNYLGSSDYLWEANESFLSAGALKTAITGTPEYFVMNNAALDPYGDQQSFYNFSGFVLIESEIIEYEAMGYTYQPIDLEQTPVDVWVYSASDVNKYLALSAPGYADATKPETAYFKPNGKYKIKKRGALGTESVDHADGSTRIKNSNIWKGSVVSFGGKQAVSKLTDGNYSQYNFTTNMQVTDQLYGNVIIIDGATSAPGAKVIIQELSETYANVGSAQTTNYVSMPDGFYLTIGSSGQKITYSLKDGTNYRITVQPKNSSGTQTGNSQSLVYRLVKNQFNGAVTANPNDPSLIQSTNQSFFKLGASNLNRNQFALAFRSFDSINVPTSTSASSGYPAIYFGDYFQSYSGSHYYSFGTTMFLDRTSVNPSQSGGLGFFINDSGARGYFIIIEALKSAASANRKSVRIVKATPMGMKTLSDSQVTLKTTLDAVYTGLAYNIDVKVKLSGQKIEINALINGTQIIATDINSSDLVKDDNWILSPTNNVGLLSIDGTMAFDYVYGSSIEAKDYEASDYVPNLYQGQFSDDIINTAYGDMIYNANLGADEASKYKLKTSVDEFGTVVREIAYVKQKFTARPAFPITWTTGANKLASVIGSKLSSFGAEAYVLNNTSVRIPLADKGVNTFAVIGNELGDSGELVYSTDDTSNYSFKEPLTFQSTWIQNEQDAKSLAEWIKEKVINKGRIVTMSIFGNPLISVGDIVSIYNTYQGFSGTEKLIVTQVEHLFNQGLETSITCRTL